MRITDRASFSSAQRAIAHAREAHQRATDEAATGMRVVHPSDDPGAAGVVAQRGILHDQFDALITTTGLANDELNAADAALSTMGDVVQRTRELAMQLSNDTYSASERAAAAGEVNALFNTLVASANARSGNRYLFGGLRDNAPPFDPAGTYLGDTGVRQLELAPGVLQSASVRADVALKGVNGGQDAFAALTTVATALSSNNTTSLRASLDTLDLVIQQISTARAQAGASANLFTAAESAARLGRDGEKAAISRLADADPFDSATQLSLAERALEASLAASAKGFDLTLLKRL